MKADYHEIEKQLAKIKAENNELKKENTRLKNILKNAKEIEKLRKTSFLFSTIMDNIPLRIYFKNTKSQFILVNKLVAQKHACKSPDELIGKTDFDFFSKELAQKFYEEEQKIIKTGTELIDYQGREIWADGRITWASTSKVPLRNQNNQIIGILGVTKDITEQKNAELALIENEKYLTKINKAKNRFFSVIAHDLKSPFNSMLGFSKLLSSNFNTLKKEEQIKYIKIIHSSIENTYKLLDNLLLWARTQLDAISFTPQKLDMYLLFEENIQILHQIEVQKSIRINNHIPRHTYAYADKNMISTVIRNLLNNALKFTTAGSKIDITHKVVTDKNEIVFSVKDYGIGIPQENINKLFDVSENISTPGLENEKGTGLGLIICKEFIENHGGKMMVESKENEGSTFSFSLPFSESLMF